MNLFIDIDSGLNPQADFFARKGWIEKIYSCFYTRCYAVFAVARCLSVRLSVTLVYCIQTAEHIVKLISRPSITPITLVF